MVILNLYFYFREVQMMMKNFASRNNLALVNTEGETRIFLKLSREPYPLRFQFCVWGSCDLVLIIWHILGVFWLLFGVFPVRYWILPIQLMVGYEGFESQLVSCIWISMQSCPCGHSGKFFKYQTLSWLVDRNHNLKKKCFFKKFEIGPQRKSKKKNRLTRNLLS